MPDTTPHKPSNTQRAEVEALSSFGVTHEDIAVYIGIDAKTLRKHYREQLDKAHMKANAAVGKFLYQAATGKMLEKGATHADCIRAATFWAKTRMGWRETQHLEHSGPNGGPIKTITSEMTPQEAADAYAATLHSDK